MAKLIYSSITSLDGYIADEDGNFDWATLDEEVHTFVDDLERQIGTQLLGRRMYKVLVAWETMDTVDQPPFIQVNHAVAASSTAPGRERQGFEPLTSSASGKVSTVR